MICTKCKKDLPESEFVKSHNHSPNRNHCSTWCKKCLKAAQLERNRRVREQAKTLREQTRSTTATSTHRRSFLPEAKYEDDMRKLKAGGSDVKVRLNYYKRKRAEEAREANKHTRKLLKEWDTAPVSGTPEEKHQLRLRLRSPLIAAMRGATEFFQRLEVERLRSRAYREHKAAVDSINKRRKTLTEKYGVIPLCYEYAALIKFREMNYVLFNRWPSNRQERFFLRGLFPNRYAHLLPKYKPKYTPDPKNRDVRVDLRVTPGAMLLSRQHDSFFNNPLDIHYTDPDDEKQWDRCHSVFIEETMGERPTMEAARPVLMENTNHVAMHPDMLYPVLTDSDVQEIEEGPAGEAGEAGEAGVDSRTRHERDEHAFRVQFEQTEYEFLKQRGYSAEEIQSHMRSEKDNV